MSTTNSKPIVNAEREAARRARVEAIKNSALVWQRLGIRAGYRRTADGRHSITLDGRTFTAGTVEQAISRARRRK
jgi:hypothetical protein